MVWVYLVSLVMSEIEERTEQGNIEFWNYVQYTYNGFFSVHLYLGATKIISRFKVLYYLSHTQSYRV